MTSAWPDPAEQALHDVAGRLRAAGCVFAEEEAALLLDAGLDAPELERFVSRRAAGEPLEHLLGWAEFAGRRVVVGPGVFVPRRRSELLVRLAVERLVRRTHEADRLPVVVDLCCGSGALAVGVGAGLTAGGWVPGEFELHAVDLDPVAAGFARRNLSTFGGSVFIGDLFAPLPSALRGRVDVILANAPYVPTDSVPLMVPEAREHEPHMALDGGADGLDLHRRIAAHAGEWLAAGGALIIEVSRRQVGVALEFLGAVGLRTAVEEDEDIGGLAIVAAELGSPRTRPSSAKAPSA